MDALEWLVRPDSVLFPMQQQQVHQDEGEWLNLFNAFIDPSGMNVDVCSMRAN